MPDKTVAELKVECDRLGIRYKAGATKPDLVYLIMKHKGQLKR